MAQSDHYLRFRQKTNDELIAKRTALESQENYFTAQSMGTKSYQQDLRLISEQLNAIAFVLAERGWRGPVAPANNYGYGITDFSQVKT